MADNEGGEANIGGNEWEVVSLTASTYAASPGPVEVKVKDGTDEVGDHGAETSKALFMSRHFIFPLEHKIQPFVPSDSSILEKDGGKHDVAEVQGVEGKSSGKDEDDWTSKDLAVPDEFPGVHLTGEKGAAGLAVHGTEFEEQGNVQELELVNKDLYSAASFSSFHSETAHVLPTNYVENVTTAEGVESFKCSSDISADQSPKSKKIKGDELYESDSDLPWWKRRAASLYAQVKAANAFWTVFVAGAVVGIAFLQQRWHQEKHQVVQLRWPVTQSMMSDNVGGAE